MNRVGGILPGIKPLSSFLSACAYVSVSKKELPHQPRDVIDSAILPVFAAFISVFCRHHFYPTPYISSTKATPLSPSLAIINHGFSIDVFPRQHNQAQQWHPNAPNPPRRLLDLRKRNEHCRPPRSRSRVSRNRLCRMVCKRTRGRVCGAEIHIHE